MNKRDPDAQALRVFFQIHWDHLTQLFKTWQDSRSQLKADDSELSQAIDTIVAGTDARMRSLTRYQAKLRDGVRSLLEYIQSIVSALPAPLEVTHKQITLDPTVKAYFPSLRSMQALFSKSPQVFSFFKDIEHQDLDAVYLLLLMHEKEKTMIGSELVGEMVRHDVMQKVVTFHGHQITALSDSEQAVRCATKQLLYANMVGHLQANIAKLKYQQAEDYSESGHVPADYNLNNPENYLQVLLEQMKTPMNFIKVATNHLKINSMGIKHPMDVSLDLPTVQIHELELIDEPTHVLSLIRLPRSELDNIKPVSFFD